MQVHHRARAVTAWTLASTARRGPHRRDSPQRLTGLLTDRTCVLLLDVRWLAHPTSPRLLPGSRRAGARPLRVPGASSSGSSMGHSRGPPCRSRSRPRTSRQLPPSRSPRPSPRPRGPAPASPSRTWTGASSPRGSPRWMRSSARAGCRVPPRSRCAGMRPRARPRSPCGWPRKRRRVGRSSRGWTWLGCSILWRPWRAASASNGLWC